MKRKPKLRKMSVLFIVCFLLSTFLSACGTNNTSTDETSGENEAKQLSRLPSLGRALPVYCDCRVGRTRSSPD